MNKNLRGYLYLLVLGVCWGPAYLLIKIAITSFPPLTLACLRVSLSSFILAFICYLSGYNILSFRNLWKKFLVMGIPCNALPFALVNLGETYISSGLTAIILGVIPVFTAILAHYTIASNETLNVRSILTAILGFSGVATIYLPSIVDGFIGNELGILFVFIASFFYASASVFAKKHFKDVPPLIVPTGQFISSSLVLIPIALLLDKPFSLPPPSTEAVLSMLGLVTLGTSFAFCVFYKSIQINGATFTSLNSLLTPVVAVVLGIIVLNEKLTVSTTLGGLMILAALVMANPYFAKKKQESVR